MLMFLKTHTNSFRSDINDLSEMFLKLFVLPVLQGVYYSFLFFADRL